MGRRSKPELFDLTERILKMHSVDKLNIEEIAEALKDEGFEISRESVRRSLKSSKELAADIKKCNDEARVIMDTVRENPDTDLMEAIIARVGGMLYSEVSSLDAIQFENPVDTMNAIGTMANAKAKMAGLRLKYNKGFGDAKAAVIKALKAELNDHPDLLERLTMIVGGLAVEEK
jgi:signal recognition particle subunit SEC65